MEPDHDVLGLEQAGWRALATAGAAEEFYRRVLDDPVVFLLPGGLRIDDREAIVDSISGPPWDWYRLDDAHVLVLGEDITDEAAVEAVRIIDQDGDDLISLDELAGYLSSRAAPQP